MMKVINAGVFAMPESSLPDVFTSAVSILGFGFIGLSFLMAYLAYRALTEVINAPAPTENVIRLARLFMYLSVALLVCAGPLHFVLLYAQYKFTKQPVNIIISLANTTWQTDSYGDVGIMKGGMFKSFSKSALNESFADGGEISIQLDKVISSIEKMRAQIIAASQSVGTATNPPADDLPDASPADTAISGG